MSIFHRSTLFRGLLGAAQIMGATEIAAGAQQLSGSEAALSMPAICSTEPRSDASEEAQYLAETDDAMEKHDGAVWRRRNSQVRSTGDFVSMMTPHHQGAIDMALAILRSGRNERIKRLALEIIVTQQQEIAAMHMAIADATAPMPGTRTSMTP